MGRDVTGEEGCLRDWVAPPNNEVHLPRSAGETERPLQVTSVFCGLEARPL